MARATYGSIITDLKGSIGGMTFQHNSSGKIVRLRPRIISRYSPSQNSKQNTLYGLVGNWHSLLVEEQLAWNTFAGLHTKDNYYSETKTLNGFQWYMSINTYRLMCGLTVLSSPPTWHLPDSTYSFNILLSSRTIILDWGSLVLNSGDYLFIYTSPPVHSASTALRNKYKFTKLVTSGGVGTTDITTSWNTAHSLTYSNIATSGDFRLAIMVFLCYSTAGLCGSVTFDIADFVSSSLGIGDMMIETDFIIHS